jgi:hypothetical protein
MSTQLGLSLLILAVSAINAYAVISQARTRKRVIRLLEDRKPRDQRTMKH